MSRNRDFVLGMDAVFRLHECQEITLPDGSWGNNCKHCDGLVYPCKTIDLLVKALHLVIKGE